MNGMITKLGVLGKSLIWNITTTRVLDINRFDGVLDDSNIKKVLADLDMFLSKFKDRKWGVF